MANRPEAKPKKPAKNARMKPPIPEDASFERAPMLPELNFEHLLSAPPAPMPGAVKQPAAKVRPVKPRPKSGK
jgi:hypothetical protein